MSYNLLYCKRCTEKCIFILWLCVGTYFTTTECFFHESTTSSNWSACLVIKHITKDFATDHVAKHQAWWNHRWIIEPNTPLTKHSPSRNNVYLTAVVLRGKCWSRLVISMTCFIYAYVYNIYVRFVRMRVNMIQYKNINVSSYWHDTD